MVKAKKSVKKSSTKKVTKKSVKRVTKKPVKKVAKKSVKRVTKKPIKKVAKKVSKPPKITKKDVKKEVKKEIKKATKIQSKTDALHKADIDKLKLEIAALKKKKASKGHVSEYNLFIRKQIRAGMSFTKAAKEWNKYKALQERNKRKPSAYNQFIGSQMRLGKTWGEAVALWKLAKAGKLGKKGSTKTIIKKVKSKPIIKYKTKVVEAKPKIKYRTRTIIKKEDSPRVIETQPQIDLVKLTKAFESSVSSKSINKSDLREAFSVSEEEIAFKIIQTYFIEIARQGFKRQLTLDEIINAYFYALARVRSKEK